MPVVKAMKANRDLAPTERSQTFHIQSYIKQFILYNLSFYSSMVYTSNIL